MGNERLRQAINRAGLDAGGLAERVEVDEKTIYRWLAGRTPYGRHRAKVAEALGTDEHELWPEVAAEIGDEDDPRRELLAASPRADEPDAPDWLALLEDATDQVELLGYSLIEILATPGVIDTLANKAAAGCQVRILISAPDSIWVRAAARELGQQQEDHIGRSALQLEIETARGYLEPLTQREGVELRHFYNDPRYTIMRFDEQMLIRPRLYGTPIAQAPVLHLARRHDGGLFDRFAEHLETIANQASQPIPPAPDLYPDPRTHPDRYQPLTATSYQQHTEQLRAAYQQHASAPRRPLEQVRAELRRPDTPAEPTPAD